MIKTITQRVKCQGGETTEAIRKLRLARGIGQAEFGRIIGVTPAAVLQMESPGCYPTADKLPAIADALSCSIDELYDRNARAYAALARLDKNGMEMLLGSPEAINLFAGSFYSKLDQAVLNGLENVL